MRSSIPIEQFGKDSVSYPLPIGAHLKHRFVAQVPDLRDRLNFGKYMAQPRTFGTGRQIFGLFPASWTGLMSSNFSHYTRAYPKVLESQHLSIVSFSSNVFYISYILHSPTEFLISAPRDTFPLL